VRRLQRLGRGLGTLAAQWKPSRSQVAEGKDEKEGKAQITVLLTINLRSSYKDLGYDQVKASLKKYNFFDQHRNENGDFINDYEAIENDFKVPVFGNKHLLRFEERRTESW